MGGAFSIPQLYLNEDDATDNTITPPEEQLTISFGNVKPTNNLFDLEIFGLQPLSNDEV